MTDHQRERILEDDDIRRLMARTRTPRDLTRPIPLSHEERVARRALQLLTEWGVLRPDGSIG